MLTYDVADATIPIAGFNEVLQFVEENSEKWRSETPRALSRRLGQFFTPLAMAYQLCSLVSGSREGHTKVIGDPGSGTGTLGLALATHLYESSPSDISVFGFETDRRLAKDWHAAWRQFKGHSTYNVDSTLLENFTENAESVLQTGQWLNLPKPAYITLNPPYVKLNKGTSLSKLLTSHGIPVPNLYAAFTVLACCWLQEEGECLVILPRSFASGDYYAPFRKWLMDTMDIEHVVLYKSRSCFKNVLQENLLLKMSKRNQSPNVRITVSENPTSKPDYDLILPAADIISSNGWLLPRSSGDIDLINVNRQRKHSFGELGLTLSTGKVELHRLSGDLKVCAIYSKDFDKDGNWTWGETKKPRYVNVTQRHTLHLPADGGFVGLKRISSNDSTNGTRLFPVWISRKTTGYLHVALDNHVQYIHKNGRPLSEDEGLTLINALQSHEANAVMRGVNGSTQINRSDIAKLRFDSLSSMGPSVVEQKRVPRKEGHQLSLFKKYAF
ncbi:Eco57I restriction-modification methylase domain-containing protein [Vibrio tubiashii]|uniref:Eco57I restriction-modification methylase domain-containing protein n=1 Tax=Vibrio tubiashii TaxID=29498 RepID=UPI001EFD357D|nr:Eco57I restriction-modification methylase domain-containing protein [Vibrio tubiashii]MCG9576086.1 Eco57I restriction-modification methylase domain-containing protein [Vibrio tubiashii]